MDAAQIDAIRARLAAFDAAVNRYMLSHVNDADYDETAAKIQGATDALEQWATPSNLRALLAALDAATAERESLAAEVGLLRIDLHNAKKEWDALAAIHDASVTDARATRTVISALVAERDALKEALADLYDDYSKGLWVGTDDDGFPQCLWCDQVSPDFDDKDAVPHTADCAYARARALLEATP